MKLLTNFTECRVHHTQHSLYLMAYKCKGREVIYHTNMQPCPELVTSRFLLNLLMTLVHRVVAMESVGRYKWYLKKWKAELLQKMLFKFNMIIVHVHVSMKYFTINMSACQRVNRTSCTCVHVITYWIKRKELYCWKKQS